MLKVGEKSQHLTFRLLKHRHINTIIEQCGLTFRDKCETNVAADSKGNLCTTLQFSPSTNLKI